MNPIKDTELTMYSPTENLSNGDPVVAHIEYNTASPNTETLGTGFESWDDLRKQILWAVEEGEPTHDIPPEVAQSLYLATGVTLFTPAAHLNIHD